MGFGALNSSLSKKGYVTSEFAQIWDEVAVLKAIVNVEVALARVQGDNGMIPKNASQLISEHAKISDALVEKARAGKVGNPLIAALDAIRSQVPNEVRGWVHFGATSQDILDTGRALQIKQSYNWLFHQLDELKQKMATLAEEHADTLMVARTNGQHALPTTLGTRFARWLAEIERSQQRLHDGYERATLVQFSGAAGTYASMGKEGMSVAQSIAAKLELSFEPVPWHASRDAITELCCTLAIYGQSLAKIAEDLFDMQRTDLAEAREQMDAHASGSSTMPQKLNPFTTMKISVGARLAAGLAATVLTQPPASFERDHRSLEVERDALPQIFIAVEHAAAKLLRLLDQLAFNETQLVNNTLLESPLLMTEGIMMVLAKHIGQEAAHDLLQDFAKEYRVNRTPLKEFMLASEYANEVEDIDFEALEDPRGYLGMSSEISRDAAKRFQNQLGE